ncbi:Hypothetical predicted protein [Drosophila guanche]|uniref:Uncharacterized protein n=1 Tax=Drosophila guanche TaxID=7266 RepID=A0A3B0JXZ0_DROGU|nr:Hypothetical predicted protein [Drosophila guanche]
MLSNKVYYSLVYIGLTIGIWSILLSPHLVVMDEKDAKMEPKTESKLQPLPQPEAQTPIKVARLVTQLPLDTLVKAGCFAAVMLLDFHLPQLCSYQFGPDVRCPSSVNNLVLFPGLLFRCFCCGRTVLGSLWMLGSIENPDLVWKMAHLWLMHFYMLSEIYVVVQYTTNVRNRLLVRHLAAANAAH